MSPRYQVKIHHPYSSILEHRKRTSWTKKTAEKHANDIKNTWAKNLKVTLELVD